MNDDGTPIVQVKDYKTSLEPVIKPIAGIAKFRGITCLRGKNPVARSSMTGPATETLSILKRGMSLTSLAAAINGAPLAYPDFLPIKDAKLKDVQALLGHVHVPPELTFYNNLTSTATPVSDEEEVE